MGNSVSAHIYETKVFRPYPVILYRLRLDPSIHWWEKIGVPGTTVQIWRTRPYPGKDPTGVKKLVSLGTTKFGVLGGKATVLVYMYDQIPI